MALATPPFTSGSLSYGGMGTSDIKRLREIEAENGKLKRMFADLALENRALKDLIEKSSDTERAPGISKIHGRDARAGCCPTYAAIKSLWLRLYFFWPSVLSSTNLLISRLSVTNREWYCGSPIFSSSRKGFVLRKAEMITGLVARP
jgi:hypothetical protein